MTFSSRRKNAGLTLIELMVSMTLGLILVSLAITAFQGGARSSEFGEAITAMQSNARFALGDLASSVRTVGYTGCSSSLKQPPLMPERVGSVAIAEPVWNPLQGYEVRAGAWLPAMPEGYFGSVSGGYQPPADGAATPVPGSSAIVLEGGMGRGAGLRAANYNPELIQTDSISSRFTPGSMALISNCSRSEAFHINRAAMSVAGGGRIETGESINRVYELNDNYVLDARVISYRRALYFIGESGRFTERNEPIRSLYEHVFPYADNAPVELAEGVDAMVIRYRMLDEDGDTREVGADHLEFDPELVVGVRLGLLLSSNTHKESEATNQAIQVAGVDVVPSSASGITVANYPDDDRIRLAFEQTAKIRNRNVGNRF